MLNQELIRGEWFVDFDSAEFNSFMSSLAEKMRKIGIILDIRRNSESIIKISSYSDMLNSIKISFFDGGHSSHCIGHIIGKSEHLDIFEDIEAAIRRIAFAPETVEPSGEFRKVCHNCGCGC